MKPVHQNQMPAQDERVSFGTTTLWFTFPQGMQPNVQPAVFSNFEPYQLARV